MSHKDSCMAEMAIHTHSFGIVSRRCEEGKLDAALQAMDLIVQQGTPITVDILYRLLHVCIQKKDLGGGRRLHCLIKKVRFESNSFLGSHLIRMFAICGSLIEAVEVFRKIPKRSVFTWNAVISANTNLGQPKHAIDLYHEMCQSEVKPNGHVFVAIVRACANAGALKQGMMVHVQICEHDLVSDLYLGSSLVDMYAKCGSLEEAWAIFDSWPTRNIVIWNAMIAGYAQHGCTHAAVQLFEVMKLNGVEPNAVTWNTLISGHIQEGHVKEAFQLSQQMQSEGVEPNIVTWNSIFAGYVQHGQGQEALECFQQMQQGGFTPNSITFLSALKACSIVASLEEGQKIHTCIIADGSESNNSVGNALVDMYSKCGCLERAHKVFERLSDKSVVTWSTMIAAYTQHGHSQEALKLFCQMQQEGIEPITVTWNAIIAGHAQHGLEKEAIRLFRQMQVEGFEPDVATFRSILKACSCIAALDSGKLIHAQVIGTEFEWDVPIGNTLIALYAKCGNLKVAQTVFSRLPTRNVVSWNSMIAGYALHNEYNLALQCLEAMQQEGVKPDDLTFVSLLAACGHLGLLDKGSHHFKSMIEEHGISLRPAHYNCMVDLLGRLGCLNEAADLLHIMPLTSNATGWKSLLSNCKTYGDLALGSHCFDSLVGMDCRHATGYMHMSSMYVDAERSNSAQDIQELRKCAYAWKVPGRAHIELDNQVHDFTVGEREHPEIDEVCAKLKKLTDYLKEDGHVPLLDLMLQTSADRAP